MSFLWFLDGISLSKYKYFFLTVKVFRKKLSELSLNFVIFGKNLKQNALICQNKLSSNKVRRIISASN